MTHLVSILLKKKQFNHDMIFGNVKNNGDIMLSYIRMMTTDHIIVPDLTHGKNKISELLSMM